MMKLTLPVLAAAAILPLVASADVRIDVNGTKDGIKIQKTAGEGFSGGKASWLPEGQQEQRIFLQKKVSKEYQEFSFAFTPDKDGNVWLSFGGNWNEDPAARPFILIDEVSINGEPLANGGFEDGFKGWGVGKNATVSSDAKAGGNAAKVNHDNNAGRNIKVEAGKSYTVKFFAKDAE